MGKCKEVNGGLARKGMHRRAGSIGKSCIIPI
jgi:hypothetical protein